MNFGDLFSNLLQIQRTKFHLDLFGFDLYDVYGVTFCSDKVYITFASYRSFCMHPNTGP